jgi:hypothetical protein
MVSVRNNGRYLLFLSTFVSKSRRIGIHRLCTAFRSSNVYEQHAMGFTFAKQSSRNPDCWFPIPVLLGTFSSSPQPVMAAQTADSTFKRHLPYLVPFYATSDHVEHNDNKT